MTSLYRYANYNAPVGYLFDKSIVEYDISKANISILREMGVIEHDTYEHMKFADRTSRQIFIGLLIKEDPTIQEQLNKGLEIAREMFCSSLKLDDTDILHVVKDAIFVVKPITFHGLPDSVQVSDLVTFTCRGRYTNYMKLFPGMYVYHDAGAPVRVRGMSEECQMLHKNFFLATIKSILDIRQMVGFSAAYNLVKASYKQLISHKGDVRYMRRFDSNSLYDFKDISNFCKFQADYLSEGAEMMVDPSFNIGILETIGSYLVSDKMSSR